MQRLWVKIEVSKKHSINDSTGILEMFFPKNGTKNRLRYQATRNVFEALPYGANNSNNTILTAQTIFTFFIGTMWREG